MSSVDDAYREVLDDLFRLRRFGVKLDILGEANLTQVGPHEWTFEPTSGQWGKWRIRAREVVGLVTLEEVRIFGIRSPVAGLLEPAFNEDADPDANLASAVGLKESSELRPLVEMTELIAERTESKPGSYGTYFKLNPNVSDIPERFWKEHAGVKIMN